MGKLEKLEQLQKLKESGSLTEEEFKQEKEKLLGGENKKSKKVIIIILTVVLLVCIVGGIYYFISNKSVETSSSGNSKKDETGFEQASANMQANGTQNLSFGNMNQDDKNLSDIQQNIISYFDNNYFDFFVKETQRYPEVFKNAKISTSAVVMKVLKSDDSEYEVLAIDLGGLYYDDFWGYGSMNINDLDTESQKQLIVIKGKQLAKRIVKGDVLRIEGRYIDTDSYNIDGNSYVLSTINAINIIQQDYQNKYSVDIIKNVAEYIFGKDIQISEPVANEDYDPNEDIGAFYKVTLDNQSNSNFKVFNMYRSIGNITYNKKHNDLSSNTTKKLFVGADFKHYIVTTYDENLKHVYIDYFDSNLNKLWRKEFNYTSTKAFVSPMDYTSDKMAVVVDNDLYLIDLKTGDFIIGPVLVGEKIKVNMMSDGIILIGDNNKDTIMKVGYDGNVQFKVNADTKMTSLDTASTQIVDGKMVIGLKGTGEYGEFEKYVVLNSNGTIDVSTEDMDISG